MSTKAKKEQEKAEKARKGKGKTDEDLDSSVLSQAAASPATLRSGGQGTLDKMLKSGSKDTSSRDPLENLQSTLQSFEQKLSKMASQDYLEGKFKKIEDRLIERLMIVRGDIQNQIKKEVEQLHKEMGDLKGQVGQIQLKQTQDSGKIFDLETKVEKLEEENKRLNTENEKLFDLFNQREEVQKKHANRLNELEQYSRRNSIRIYGIDDSNPNETPIETTDKVINFLRTKLELIVEIPDIDIAHRMGTFMRTGNRPIICKFVQRLKKFEAIRARRKLKGTHYVIKEDLTQENVKRIRDVSEVENVTKVWSDNGKIIALLNTEDKMLITYKTDLSKPLVPLRRQKAGGTKTVSSETCDDTSHGNSHVAMQAGEA